MISLLRHGFLPAQRTKQNVRENLAVQYFLGNLILALIYILSMTQYVVTKFRSQISFISIAVLINKFIYFVRHPPIR